MGRLIDADRLAADLSNFGYCERMIERFVDGQPTVTSSMGWI